MLPVCRGCCRSSALSTAGRARFPAGAIWRMSGACSQMAFDRQIALIAGASYGIGMARQWQPTICCINELSLLRRGLKAHGYVCDVTDEMPSTMVARSPRSWPHINILVNNAGIIKRIPMTEMSAAQFRQVIDVDLNALPSWQRPSSRHDPRTGRRQDHQHLLHDE